nr:PTS sugar transporter subunit IIA [Neorhizobium alkalisoli]
MISEIPPAGAIWLDLRTKGKHSALSKIAIKMAPRSKLDQKTLLHALLRRECSGSTGVGRGIAIPHALLDIPSPLASFSRLEPPIDFDGPDDDAVDLVYTLLWPRGAGFSFLPALSKVCRTLRAPWIREGLRQAQSADEVRFMLGCDPRRPPSPSPVFVKPDLGLSPVGRRADSGL